MSNGTWLALELQLRLVTLEELPRRIEAFRTAAEAIGVNMKGAPVYAFEGEQEGGEEVSYLGVRVWIDDEATYEPA